MSVVRGVVLTISFFSDTMSFIITMWRLSSYHIDLISGRLDRFSGRRTPVMYL